MKRNLLGILFICLTTVVFAGSHNQSGTSSNKENPPHISTINANDTVVLDLSQQIVTGSNISFPVSILSDDTIFSLDFSFKYNQNSFTYDTIVDIAATLQSLSYYNTNDSIVRYTSYSLQNIPVATPLVSVHFTTLAGKICSQDFNTVTAYLNGDVCSVKLITCTTTGLIDLNKNNASISIYPNPSNEIINIESAENATIELCDLDGKTIISQKEILSGEKLQLNISKIANGVYMLKTLSQNSISVQKVVIQK